MLPEETPVQDRESNGSLKDHVDVVGGLAAVDTQTIDSLVQQTTDGKGVICSIYLSTAIMN